MPPEVALPAIPPAPPPSNGLPPLLRLSRRAIESRRRCGDDVVPAAAAVAPAPAFVFGFGFGFVPVGGLTLLLLGCGSPGTTPCPVRRAMRARITLSHLISSSSLGAQSRSVRFVVTILNVCVPALSPPSGDEATANCGEAGPGDAMLG